MFRNRRDPCAAPPSRASCLARSARQALTCPVTRTRYCALMEPITTVSDNRAAFAALSDDELVERVKDLRCVRAAYVRGAHPLAGGVRRSQAVSPRRLFLTFHLLHARAASVGRIGLQPNRNRTGGAALSDRDGGALGDRCDGFSRGRPRFSEGARLFVDATLVQRVHGHLHGAHPSTQQGTGDSQHVEGGVIGHRSWVQTIDAKPGRIQSAVRDEIGT